jgi:hypothetical protein
MIAVKVVAPQAALPLVLAGDLLVKVVTLVSKVIMAMAAKLTSTTYSDAGVFGVTSHAAMRLGLAPSLRKAGL